MTQLLPTSLTKSPTLPVSYCASATGPFTVPQIYQTHFCLQTFVHPVLSAWNAICFGIYYFAFSVVRLLKSYYCIDVIDWDLSFAC